MRKILISAITVAMAASLANAFCDGAGALNMDVWFNGSIDQVNTGADGLYEYEKCETTTMGYWYDYDDRNSEDKGGSSAWYAFIDTTIDLGVENLVRPKPVEPGYFLIGYDLKDPTLTGQEAGENYNFVAVGFNIADGDHTPFDISGTGGLCVTYTADHPISFAIDEGFFNDNVECFVSLDKTDYPTTVNFSIEDFAQPENTSEENKIDCADVFKAAARVTFVVYGEGKELSGALRIFSIGPKGTCTPGTLAKEPSEFCNKSDGKGHVYKQETCLPNIQKILSSSSSAKAKSSSSSAKAKSSSSSAKAKSSSSSAKAKSSSSSAKAKSSSSSAKAKSSSSSAKAKSSSSSKKGKSSSSKKDADFISDLGSVNSNFEITISGNKALLQIPGSGFAKVTVMDMQGRIVKPSAMVKTGSVEISLAEINQGKYIVSVEQKSVRRARPITIK